MQILHHAFNVCPPAHRLRHWLGADLASIAKLRGGYLHHKHLTELYRPTPPVVNLPPGAMDILLDLYKAEGVDSSWLSPQKKTEDPGEKDRGITFESIVKGNKRRVVLAGRFFDQYADRLRHLDGAHTFFIIFGFDDIVGEFYEKLMDAIKLPEAAVIAVQDKVEAARVGRIVGCRRVWQPEGFTVIPASPSYWPQGHCSESHEAEFLYSWYRNRDLRWRRNPMPPTVESNGSSRGYATVHSSLNERGFTAVSFWKAYAAKGLKEPEWYTRMGCGEGVRKKALVFLESRQQMLEEVDIAAKQFKDWMDPAVATALDDRDQILRKCGFPELMLPDRMPDDFRNDPLLEKYRLHGGINPLVFTSLQPYWSPGS